MTIKPEIFEKAFLPGATKIIDAFTVGFYTLDIGRLKIESGKIIACDPIFMTDWTPFTQIFPIGEFPVQLAIATINVNETIVFSRILFSNNSVAKWEFALHVGQMPIPIFTDSIYGYGVDCGLGCFIDEKSKDAFGNMSQTDEKFADTFFESELTKHPYKFGNCILYNFNHHNLAVFTSGIGDGHYGTYIGFDVEGKVCRLLTDFNLVPWKTE